MGLSADEKRKTQRFCDLDVGVADDLPVTAVERDPTTPDLRDHAETIEFVLKDPIGIVER